MWYRISGFEAMHMTCVYPSQFSKFPRLSLLQKSGAIMSEEMTTVRGVYHSPETSDLFPLCQGWFLRPLKIA